jgi:enediyne biosynthesis protein E3
MMIEGLLRRAILANLPKKIVLRRHRLLGPTVSREIERRLERAAAAFLDGLRTSVKERSLSRLRRQLISHDSWERGFAFEGAAMGVCLVDGTFLSRRKRFAEFLDKGGRSYAYLIYVGAGWAFGRQHIAPKYFLNRLDSLLGWLAVDGYGFYLGLFESDYTSEQELLSRCAGYAGRALRQGYGRALWFLARGSVPTIAQAIERLPENWRADLWSGIGLACVYAGELAADELVRLRRLAGDASPAVAVGAAFAAKARKLGGGLCCDPADKEAQLNVDYYNLACQILCDVNAHTAASITDDALDDLPPDGEEPAYEIWRQRVQKAIQEPSVRKTNSTAYAELSPDALTRNHAFNPQNQPEMTVESSER